MQAWNRCMLGLVPSTWSDPCPTVAMEAMAMSRPLIATRMGGLTDLVVDGENGLLVPPDDVEALRQAMAALLSNPARCEQMGQAGKRRLAAFQASHVVQRLEELYVELAQAA